MQTTAIKKQINSQSIKIIKNATITLTIVGVAMAFVNIYAAAIFFAVAAVLHFKSEVGLKLFTVLTWIVTGYIGIALLLMLMLFNVFFLGWLTNSGGLLLIVSQLVLCAGLLVYMHSTRKQLASLKFAHESKTDLYRSRYAMLRSSAFVGLALIIVGCAATYYTSTEPFQERIRNHINASDVR